MVFSLLSFLFLHSQAFAQDDATLFYRQCLAENKARMEMVDPLLELEKKCTALQLNGGSKSSADQFIALDKDLTKLYHTAYENMVTYVPYMQVEAGLSLEKKRDKEAACALDNHKLIAKNQATTNLIRSCLKNFSAPQIKSNQNENKAPRPPLVIPPVQNPSDTTRKGT